MDVFVQFDGPLNSSICCEKYCTNIMEFFFFFYCTALKLHLMLGMRYKKELHDPDNHNGVIPQL